MGATPQLPRDDFWKFMSELERRIALIEQRSPFLGTGLSAPAANTTQVDGNLNVVGSSTVSGTNGIKSSNYVPGTAGWNFTGTSLEANTGVIGNGALADPVTPGVVNSVATNFALTAGSWTSVVSFSATVPANCTRLLALATGMAFVVNPNTTGGSNGAGGDIVECRIGVGGNFGMAAGVSISGSNGQTSCPAAVAVLLTGLTPGATVTLVTQGATGWQNFAANGSNQANLCATLTWLR